ACVAYLVINKLALWGLGIAPEARGSFLAPADIPVRLREIGRLLPRLLVRDRELGAPLLGGLQVLLLAAALLLAARARKPSIPALLAVALASVIGIVGLVKIFWPTPRVLTAMGFFWGGVVAVCFRLAPPRAQKI